MMFSMVAMLGIGAILIGGIVIAYVLMNKDEWLHHTEMFHVKHFTIIQFNLVRI